MPLLFNSSPYFNDYDESKLFQDVLFRPGYAVQARELTQLQSLMESQIARFGRHIFQEGSMVIPGQITYDQNLAYVKLKPTFSLLPVVYSLLDPSITGTTVTIQGVLSGIQANIVMVNSTTNSLYVKYINSGIDNATKTFSSGEDIKLVSNGTSVCTVLGSAATGVTSVASIQDGVYFVYGRFLKVNSQTIRIADFDPIPSARVGLQVIETIITPEDDISLTDNAAGSPNYAAPGAHRYKIELQLVSKAVNDVTDESFVELLRLDTGIIQSIVKTTIYSEIEKTLARRTEDVNGSFTVRPFTLSIREHLNSGTNGGVYLPPAGDITKLVVAASPGKAYVQGHEIENIVTDFTNIDKAQDTSFVTNSRTRGYLGNYILVNRLFGIPNYDTLPKITLYDSHIVTDGVVPGTAVIGSATIRGIEYHSGSFTTPNTLDPTSLNVIPGANAVYKVFLTDINILDSTRSLLSARSFAVNDGTITTTANILHECQLKNVSGSFTPVVLVSSFLTLSQVVNDTNISGLVGVTSYEPLFSWDQTKNTILVGPRDYLGGADASLGPDQVLPNNSLIKVIAGAIGLSDYPIGGKATLVKRTVLFDTSNDIIIYPLPQKSIASVRDKFSQITTTYTYRKVFSPQAEAGGAVTFSVSTNEVFATMATTDYLATIESGSNTGKVIDVSSSSPTFPSGATQLRFNVPSGTNIKLSATVVKQIASEKTKTLITVNKTQTSPGNVITLDHCDCYAPVGIWLGTDNTGTPINDRYIFDTGMRDNLYDFGTLTLKPGSAPPGGTVFITYQYFTHGAGDYFCVNSYNNFGGFLDWYSRIPTYTSATGNGTYILRDCLDFRPKRDETSPSTLIYPSGVGKLVKPNDDIISDFSYYLGRIDKFYLDPTGIFKILRGSPALSPLPPSDPTDGGMVIASIQLGPFTLGPTDTVVKMVENKRYTMRDIGKLETRIANLEYYTSLNLLEKETVAFSILDAASGLDRFKQGFVVDPFTDQGVVDTTNSDLQFSIDAPNKIMRPTYNSDSISMFLDTVQSSNFEYRSIKPKNKLVTLPYTEVSLINQDKASRFVNLNPYNVFNYIGIPVLDPSTDTWKDTVNAPAILVTDTSSYSAVKATGDVTTVWGEWQTEWIGAPVTSTNTVETENANAVVAFDPVTGLWSPQSGPSNIGTSSTTTAVTVSTSQSRKGIQTTTIGVPQEIVNNKILNVALAPYIRPIPVNFSCTRLKPLTRHYVYFDEVNVTSFCFPTGGALNDPIITDANGFCSGTFNIPATTFRVGRRVFRLCDDPTNNSALITSFGDTQYNASGLIENDQQTITTTEVPQVQKKTVTDTRTISAVTSSTTSSVSWIDPLAQSILVSTLTGGFMLTGIDLFFQSKDGNVPVTIQLRTMLNGYPTQTVVPFSEVTLNPSSVNVSADASSPTRFSFDSPVFLQSGVEYAIVAMSNCNSYNAWIATIGDLLLNSDRYISAVPYAGPLFKSQNASTWTADQGSALKFTCYRAKFNTSVTGMLYFENPALVPISLPSLSLITYNTLNQIRVLCSNHGMSNGSKCTITIPSGNGVNWGSNYNGILVNKIVPTVSGDLRSGSWASGVADTVLGSRTYTIANVEVDSFTISIVDGSGTAVNASSSGRSGVALTVTVNKSYDVMCPTINEMNFSGTNSNWFLRAILNQSVHGSQTPYQRDLTGSFPFTGFQPGNNIFFDSPRVVASPINESVMINIGTAFDNKSLVFLSELTSTVDNLSPIIDTTRCSAIVVSNRIDNRTNGSTPASTPSGAAPLFVAETAKIGNTGPMRYIQRPVKLANSATAIHVLISVMRPSEASIDVYYRILPSDTNAIFTNQPFILMTPDPNTDFSPAQNPTDFKDYYWLADSIGSFVTFQIKVVMRSTNSSHVPLCKDYRAIALAL